MRSLVAIAILAGAAPAAAAPLWTEAPPPDGAMIFVGSTRWVRFQGAWYRAEHGELARSPDGTAWTPVAGAPRAYELQTAGGALFADAGKDGWRSTDGEHFAQVKGDLRGRPRLLGDATLLLGATGTSTDFRCSTDGGATWTKPGKGWVDAPSVYGVNVVDGEAWVGFHTGKQLVQTYSRDRCKTWKIIARGRYVTRAAKGVVVESDLEKTEVSFDGRKTWIKSPVVASDTSHTLLQVATERGLLDSSKDATWFVTAAGPRKVPMDGLAGVDLANAVARVLDGYVYISYQGKFYRAAIADLAALP